MVENYKNELQYVYDNWKDLEFFYIDKYDEKFLIHTLPAGWEFVGDETKFEYYQKLIDNTQFFNEFLKVLINMKVIPDDRYLEFHIQKKDSKHHYPYNMEEDLIILVDEYCMKNKKMVRVDKLDFPLKDFRYALELKSVGDYNNFQNIFEHLDCITSGFSGIEVRNIKDNTCIQLESESYTLLTELTNKKLSKKREMNILFKFYRRQELKTLQTIYPEYTEKIDKLFEVNQKVFDLVMSEARNKTDMYDTLPASIKSWIDKLRSYKSNQKDFSINTWKTFLEIKEITYEDILIVK